MGKKKGKGKQATGDKDGASTSKQAQTEGQPKKPLDQQESPQGHKTQPGLQQRPQQGRPQQQAPQPTQQGHPQQQAPRPTQQQPQQVSPLPTWARPPSSPQQGSPPAWGPHQKTQQPIQMQAPQQQGPPHQAPLPHMPQQQRGQLQHVPQQSGLPQQSPRPQMTQQQRGQPQNAPQQPGSPHQTVPPGFVPSGVMPPQTSPARGEVGVSVQGGDKPGGGDKPKQAGRGRGAKPKQQQQQQQQHRPGMSGDQASPKKLVALTHEMSLEPLPLVKVKPGVNGRVIKVETNHLALNLGKLDFAYHYDVDLVPDTPKKFLRAVMDRFQKQHYPNINPAFDGRKNLYSIKKLCPGDFISGEIVIQDTEGRDKTYKVEVKFANMVDLRPLRNYDLCRQTPRDALQVVDIVLRCAPSKSLITAGRSFFHKPQGEILDLGEGMEMYYGFYQSAIRGWKPFLNVDVAHKAFPKSIPVTDALIELFSGGYNKFDREDLKRPLNENNKREFEKFIKALRVIYQIPGQTSTKRIFRVNGLAECASRKTFEMEDNGRTRTITIKDYFEHHKRYKLKYPELPTLWVGSQARKANPILVPLELCLLEEGQVLNRKMSENQTAKMIRYSATNTALRKKKIVDGMGRANHNVHPVVREFGFSVSDKFEQLDARVLKPPQLGYTDPKNPRMVNPFKGVWRNERFVNPAQIKNWTIVCADRRDPRSNDLNNLERGLIDAARGTGIQFSQADKPFRTIGNTQVDIKRYFQSVVDKKYNVIFVIVPNSGSQYSYVKTAAEINVGCLTQCIKMKTLGRANVQTCLNILLKVNAKLNGTNHFLLTRPPILSRPCMIMGADVTHPSPEAQHIPSVAAVTASFDPKAFKYNICWRLQPPKLEIIEDLQKIVIEQLIYFYQYNNGHKPERIIFFRDGVSEGQFEQVLSTEVRAIRAACKQIQQDGYEPSITFLVVQKRHHTRLFPLDPKDSEDGNCNVPAGTCVDYQITHPFLQDFYLVSHASIQGVAKPTKYCTLLDENKLSNDDIEQLTYFLCHMFARCNRSVSYPAPTYYAHLAAARAKVYIENDTLDLNNLQREYDRFTIQDTIRKGTPMFFV